MPIIGREKVSKAIDVFVDKKNDLLQAQAVRLFSEIIIGTPVDKGRARANWFLSQNIPSNKTTENTQPSTAFKDIPKKIFGKKIFLTNNLPYIEVLEFGGFPKKSTEKTSRGFSRLAPGGWVRVALKRMQKRIKLI